MLSLPLSMGAVRVYPMWGDGEGRGGEEVCVETKRYNRSDREAMMTGRESVGYGERRQVDHKPRRETTGNEETNRSYR